MNAIDASARHSKIIINAQLQDGFFISNILDNGAGMPFIPDPRAASAGPSTKRFGTGLGIPFAFKVCEVLSGQIVFETIKPQGTSITLTLPQ